MSARYSLLVILVVAAVLTINSLWLHKTNDHVCAGCEYLQQTNDNHPEKTPKNTL